MINLSWGRYTLKTCLKTCKKGAAVAHLDQLSHAAMDTASAGRERFAEGAAAALGDPKLVPPKDMLLERCKQGFSDMPLHVIRPWLFLCRTTAIAGRWTSRRALVCLMQRWTPWVPAFL